MTGRRLAGTFWPSRRERLLLLTALAEPDRALEAWQELRPELDLQTMEDSVFAALPLVYRRLDAAGLDDPDLSRLKGIYRNTWTRNTLLVDRLRSTADAFRAAEVRMLLVGTLGAALRYYDAVGLRPTGYVELLVSRGRRGSCSSSVGKRGLEHARRLTRAGRPASPLRRGGPALRAPHRTRPGFRHDFRATSAGMPFWDAAVDIDANGVPVPALSPGDDLLSAIVTGARANPTRSLQWIVDAAMILRTPEQIDWERFCRIGIERGQGLRLRETLRYLEGLLDSAPPPAVQESLDRRKPPARERLTYAFTARSIPGLGSFPQALGEHLGATTGRSSWATAATLPAFLRTRWNVEHTWQLPFAGGQRALRTLGRRRAGPADRR